MITSKKQLKVAKDKIRMLQESLSAEPVEGIPSILVDASRKQTQEMILEIEKEVVEFEHLQKIGMVEVTVESVDDLLKLPTQYRLINHLSVDQFARLVGKSARQILRYEEEDYSNINIGTFTEILQKLPIEIKGKAIGKKATA